MKDLLSIVSHFQLADAVREIKPLGSGLINCRKKGNPILNEKSCTSCLQTMARLIGSMARTIGAS